MFFQMDIDISPLFCLWEGYAFVCRLKVGLKPRLMKRPQMLPQMVKIAQLRSWHQAASLCGLKGHYATTCPKLALTALAALTKTSPAMPLADRLRAGKPLKVGNAAMKGWRTLQRASKESRKVDKGLKQKNQKGLKQKNQSYKIERMKRDGNLPNENKVRHCWLDSQWSSVCLPELVGVRLGVEARMLWMWKQFSESSLENMPPTRAWGFLSCYECESSLSKHLTHFMLAGLIYVSMKEYCTAEKSQSMIFLIFVE